MKISEAKECIKELHLNTDSVTALISERGIGKTSAYMQCANELGIGYIGLYGAALEGPDFMGLPDKDKEKGITKYLAPQFLPTKQAINDGLHPPKGILVMEEINRVPSDTVSVLYPLLLEKKINGHEIGEGWSIGVTMNPDTMNYLVNSLDDAMIDRFISIEVKVDIDDYIEYSLRNNYNDKVLAYLQACPDMLLVTKKSADSTALAKLPTPRGWSKIQELLNNCVLSEHLMKELVSGIVGANTATAFFGFLNNRDLVIPSTKDIVENYNNVKNNVRKLIDNNNIDILNYIIKKIIVEFNNTDLHIRNIDKLLRDLPEEMQILFVKYLSTERENDMDIFIDKSEMFGTISDKIIDIVAN